MREFWRQLPTIVLILGLTYGCHVHHKLEIAKLKCERK